MASDAPPELVGSPHPELALPIANMITIADRNVLIKQRFEEGESLTDIAVDFDRVAMIITKERAR
jgi:hypothetical protein